MFKSLVDSPSDIDFINKVKSSHNIAELTEKLGFKWKNCGENSRKKIRERMRKLNVNFKDNKDIKIKKINLNNSGRIGITKAKGDISECAISLLFLEKGIPVSKPFGDNCPYDLIIDYKNKLYKVQVKTLHLLYENKTLSSKIITSTIGLDKKRIYRKYKPEEVDIFAFYCMETKESCFCLYNELLGKENVYFCRTKINNNPHKKYIGDYNIERLFLKLS